MPEAGYKQLVSYQLSKIAFELGWEITPILYPLPEDKRQRDQIRQALRSYKQNIVEGSSERSLSLKLNLYSVAKSSGLEAGEDFEDYLLLKHQDRWSKDDPRLWKLRRTFESFPNPPTPSNPSRPSLTPSPNPPTPPNPSPRISPHPSLHAISEILHTNREETIIAAVNYLIDVIIRGGYLLDRQINAVEEKHRTEGGYRENLYKKRMEYKRTH
jgi:four helix bundle suffix protein